MQLLIAVIEDLFWFAHGALFGPRTIRTERLGTVLNNVVYVPPRPERIAILPPQEVSEHTTPIKVPHAHLESVFDETPMLPKKNTVLYVATVDAPLRSTPKRGTDTVIKRMPFGSMLVALEQEGEWIRVFFSGTEGFVETVDVADRAAFVHPHFVIGQENTAHDPSTVRVRAMINDEFSYGEGDAPLQAEEYVLYKLYRNGVRILWPSTRPRSPGTWHSILKDNPEVRIHTAPVARGVIEWADHGGGHIAFVESMTSDGAIRISEANWPDSGRYNERVMVEEEWRPLAPFFISFP